MAFEAEGAPLAAVTWAGPVATVTIDNPPFNAFHPDVAEALHECVREVAARPDARCVVLTGAGRFFMAGGDLNFIRELTSYRAERYVLRIQEIQDGLRQLAQPVVAAINGTALGGGLELALACDIRVAGRSAQLGFPEVSLGIIPGAGGTQNTPRTTSPGHAKRLLFTADRITADEALAIGLVEQVVDDDKVLATAHAIAERISANAPLAVTAAKRAVDLGLQTGVAEGHRIEATLFAPLIESNDFHEGIAAFFDKRPPNYART